jgi:hypothetical protein
LDGIFGLEMKKLHPQKSFLIETGVGLNDKRDQK